MKITKQQILDLRSQGLSVAQIAAHLGVSQQTIYYHISDKYKAYQKAYQKAYRKAYHAKVKLALEEFRKNHPEV